MTRQMLLEVMAFHQIMRDEVGQDGGMASLLLLMF